jgi:hypothetical protein
MRKCQTKRNSGQEQAQNYEMILSTNDQHRYSNETFYPGDLIDGATLCGREPRAGSGVVEKGPNGAIAR